MDDTHIVVICIVCILLVIAIYMAGHLPGL
jgi:hypothetical protein